MNSDLQNRLPEPDEQRIAIRVKSQVEPVLRGGHPWLYEQAITSISRDGAAGDIAVVFDQKGRFLAAGLYDPDSSIRVRLLVHGRSEAIGATLFRQRLEVASEMRRPLLSRRTNGYRLSHGANDGLAGVVVDRYDRTLVVKLYSAAWFAHLRALLWELDGLMAPERIVLRLSRQLAPAARDKYGLEDGQTLIGHGPDTAVPFLENGLLFEADVIHGQKTGFFLDQRENRQRVEQLAAERSVLNVFSYSGAFSVYAARGGASRICSLDQSRPALEAARRHFALNQDDPDVRAAVHETIEGDAFAELSTLSATKDKFGMVILDPPAFARRQSEAQRALSAYRRLAMLGLALLEKDGVLVASSCSSQVTADMFFNTISEAARDYGRPLQEIERTGHALDHPIGFKEGSYLKTLFARPT
jgi:23S rRNA (cytosine1962-C5)-methyltransferase